MRQALWSFRPFPPEGILYIIRYNSRKCRFSSYCFVKKAPESDCPVCFSFIKRSAKNVWRSSSTSAKLIKRLYVSGQDLGEPCKRFWGSDEYEYWYTFDEENTEKLLFLLSKEGTDPVEQLQKRFNGTTACRSLRTFCEAGGIAFQFSNWIP